MLSFIQQVFTELLLCAGHCANKETNPTQSPTAYGVTDIKAGDDNSTWEVLY